MILKNGSQFSSSKKYATENKIIAEYEINHPIIGPNITIENYFYINGFDRIIDAIIDKFKIDFKALFLFNLRCSFFCLIVWRACLNAVVYFSSNLMWFSFINYDHIIVILCIIIELKRLKIGWNCWNDCIKRMSLLKSVKQCRKR